jgi:hypothetical protein
VSPGTRRLRRSLLWGAIAIAICSGGALALAAKRISKEQAFYNGPNAARCVPQQLDRSDVLAHTSLAVAPLPGSYDAMPQTQISLLGAPASDLSEVSATGSMSGDHAGRLEAYSQGDGASFVPDQPFRQGETVTVRGRVREGQGNVPFSYSFGVAYPDPIPVKTRLSNPRPTPPAGSVQLFHSAPELEAPSVDVTTDAAGVAAGDVFIAPYSGPGRNGPTIVDRQGQLVWMDPLPEEMKATNLQVQTYEGKPVLTWWQGYIPEQGFGEGEEIVANTSYEQFLHVKAGNGNLADLHDFHLEPDHTAVTTVFRTIHCDLSSAHGPKDAAVTDTSYQEIDVKTGLVRREWNAVNHVSFGESYSEALGASTAWPFDYFHLNTIDPRPDGTTLISARNTCALYVLDTHTGQIEQEIGGKKSDVRMESGAQTAFQHDAMTLPNGEISIFDNGGTPFEQSYSHGESRGVVVSVRQGADTLVQELKHPGALKAGSQGDVQEMAGGAWFVGWGQEPYFTEYNSSGQMIYDAHMWAVKENKALETESYRTYKFPWKATPYWPPSIAAKRSGEVVEAWVSWNGATEVASWRLLGGSSESQMKPLASGVTSGFETTLRGTDEPYVSVQALNSAGEVIGNSKAVKPAG